MQTPSATVRPRRSAFAAAFFSFILPGLGHAYLGRWARGLAWASAWVLAVALVAGIALAMGIKDFAIQFADPDWLVAALIGIGIDMVYRLVCLLDAYHLAADPPAAHDGVIRRMGSSVGLVAVLAVLALTHITVATPVLALRDTVTSFSPDDPGAGSSIDPDPDLGTGFIEAPTPTPEATPGPTPEPGATETPTPAPTPTPVPTPTQGPDWGGTKPLNILLIGMDSGRSGGGGGLTDTMITISIDPVSKKVAFISLPRDTTYVPLPRSWGAGSAYADGLYPNKINTLYVYARSSPSLYPFPDKTRGYDALKGALSELYGIDIQYFVSVDLDSFREVIDALGGVVIDVQNPVYDAHYPSSDGGGAVKLYIPPGIQYMAGKEALAYARARHATSDFDRSARQQRVVTSVREQLDLPSLLAPGKIQELLRILKKSIRTDVPPKLLPKMIQLAQEIDLDKRISLVLTPPRYSRTCYLSPPPCPQDNSQYLLQANVAAIRKAVANVFKSNPAEEARLQRIEAEGAAVSVLNGTAQSNLKTTRIADYLAEQGVEAVVPPVNGGAADRTDYPDTVITVYNGAELSLPTTINVLEKALGVTAVSAEDPAQEADIVIIVGNSTPALRPET